MRIPYEPPEKLGTVRETAARLVLSKLLINLAENGRAFLDVPESHFPEGDLRKLARAARATLTDNPESSVELIHGEAVRLGVAASLIGELVGESPTSANFSRAVEDLERAARDYEAAEATLLAARQVAEGQDPFAAIGPVIELAKDGETRGWPPLVPLDRPDLPQANPRLLPGWAGEYAEALAASTETPPELATGLILATCSACAARRFRVLLKPGYTQPTNLWIAVSLPPGNRKSAVQSGAVRPLVEWERQEAKAMAPEIARASSLRKTEEARVAALRKKAATAKNADDAEQYSNEAAELEASLSPVPVAPRLWTSDATPERIGTLLVETSECLAWLSSEGGVFDLLAGRYSKGIPNLDLILKAADGDAERIDRMGRPSLHLHEPLLSIGISPQPDVIRKLSDTPSFLGRGLLGRFLYFLPVSPLGTRKLNGPPVPELINNAYAAGVWRLLEMPYADPTENTRHILTLSPKAREEWEAFGQAMEATMAFGGTWHHATDWAGKAPGMAGRLAAVLHVIHHAHGKPWSHPIERETMGRALELMAIIAEHSRATRAIMGADESVNKARRAWEWIERSRRPVFTLRDMHRAMQNVFPRISEARASLEPLEERGYIRVDEKREKRPGRPSSAMVRVNPTLARAWQ